MTLTDLDDAGRRQRGLGRNELALFVKAMGQYNKHAAAKKAGFLKEDVIVAIDEFTSRVTEGELIGRLLQTTRVGDAVEVTVLRGKDRLAIKLPMQ
jgi:hypothetical protein